MDRYAIIGGPTRVIRVIYIAAFAGNDLGGDLLNCMHNFPAGLRREDGINLVNYALSYRSEPHRDLRNCPVLSRHL